MDAMFESTNYNQDLTGWNTSNVTSMTRMFRSNDSFNQNISSWDINQVTIFNNFLYQGDGLSTANYDAILIGWDAQGAMSYSGTFNFGSSQYSCRAEAARTSLISKWGGITDGGLNTSINCNFVSTWDTTQAGSASDTIVLPLLSGGVYSGTIDWGDGNASPLSYANRTHIYASSGTYTITITGQIDGWRFAGGGDRRKITNVSNWGTLNITTSQAFFNCTNMACTATDAPTFTSTDLSYTFFGCSSFNSPVNHWDIGGATNISQFFGNASVFNQDLDNWDVSLVTNMSNMFSGASAFNGSLYGWVLNASVTALSAFLQNSSFNNSSLNGWNVSNVQRFNGMFRNTPFNQDISNWNMSSATRVDQMFFDVTAFNQNIGGWVLSNCTNMGYLLFNCDAFDQDISGWDINQVSTFTSFMQSATGLSTANYDALLIAWDAQGAMSYSGTVNFGGSTYTLGGAAETARTSLISKWGGIIDGGGV
jgi:surface protein